MEQRHACIALYASNSSFFFLHMIFYALDDGSHYLGKNFLEVCDDHFSEVATYLSSFDCSLNQIKSEIIRTEIIRPALSIPDA